MALAPPKSETIRPAMALRAVRPDASPAASDSMRKAIAGRHMTGFQRQRRVVRFDGRNIDQRAYAFLSGGDLASTNEARQGAFTDRQECGSIAW